MIKVYYLSNNNSGRKAMNWLEKHNLQMIERKITKKYPIEISENKHMLVRAENGFDDLIKWRTKKFTDLVSNVNDCSTEYLIDILIKYPTLIKLPIIIDEKKLFVGFNEREIRCFLSKIYRHTQLLISGGYTVDEEFSN